MTRRGRRKRRTRNRGHPLRKVVAIGTLLVVSGLAIGVLAGVAWVISTARSAPNLSALKPRQPHPLTRIYGADGALLGYVHTDTVFNYTPPWRIPKTLKKATVAIEDRRFWQHGALDYQGIVRAGIKDLFGTGKSLQGASTLTM
jgi:penicillin-binding protein 1A